MTRTSAKAVRHRPSALPPQQPMPRHIAPMLAVPSHELPRELDEYAFEYKWDGVRALCFLGASSLRLESRNQLDITDRYPELHALHSSLHAAGVILDGEIVATDDLGRPSFARLQRRMHVASAATIRRLARQIPAQYLIFDVLYAHGRSVMDLPFRERRRLLEELTVAGPSWSISPAIPGEGPAMLSAAREHRLEGLVAKRLDSIYEPGRRSPAWRKIKIIRRQEFVVGGWTRQAGAPGRVGALLIGYYDCGACRRGGAERASLRYAGRVGSGFTDQAHAELAPLLERGRSASSPFADPVPVAEALFVEPQLVVEVEYRRWPEGGLVQQAAFKGIRQDKNPREVVKEVPAHDRDVHTDAIR